MEARRSKGDIGIYSDLLFSFVMSTRDGSEILRDPRNGGVLAEILLKSNGSSDKVPVLASFSSPWPLGEFGFPVYEFPIYSQLFLQFI